MVDEVMNDPSVKRDPFVGGVRRCVDIRIDFFFLGVLIDEKGPLLQHVCQQSTDQTCVTSL